MFHCSIGNSTHPGFLKLRVHVSSSGFGKATRDPGDARFGFHHLWVKWCLSLFVTQGEDPSPAPSPSPAPAETCSGDSTLLSVSLRGNSRSRSVRFFAAWVVLPAAGVRCAGLAWGIARGHGRWSRGPSGLLLPGCRRRFLFIAACFLLASQPEIVSTHFGEQRALGISTAGEASLCTSAWEVSQVLAALGRRHGSGAALGAVPSLCVGTDSAALLRAARTDEGRRRRRLQMYGPSVKRARDSLSFSAGNADFCAWVCEWLCLAEFPIGNHRITECSRLEGTSVGHPAQPSC